MGHVAAPSITSKTVRHRIRMHRPALMTPHWAMHTFSWAWLPGCRVDRASFRYDSSMSESRESDSPRRRPRYPGTHPRRFEQRYKELRPEAYPGIQEHVRERGGTPAGTHVPIMVEEIMTLLRPQPGEMVADCTLGYGGHAAEFLKRIGPSGLLVGFDVDGEQLERTAQRLRGEFPEHRLVTRRGNFAGIAKWIKPDAGGREESVPGFDIIFADLGVSSMQIDDPSRGFTYKWNAPLDMRMDRRLKRTAADLLNNLSQEELSSALRDLADEPDHERIARFVVEQRARRAIRHTDQLVQIVMAAKRLIRSKRDRAPRTDLPEEEQWADELVGAEQDKQPKLHPAARTFQALRIMVNDELGSLAALLRVAPYCLRPGGRIGIITFHSGEDRLVKHAFRDGQAAGVYAGIATEVTRPSPHERYDNPRSSAAKFRWAVRASG